MINNNVTNSNSMQKDYPYLETMTKEELEELYDEVMCTIERRPKRVKRVVKPLPVRISER